MNTIEVMFWQAINKAIDLSEKEYQGLLLEIKQQISVGANIGMIFMMAQRRI
jgi:3-hydroxyacyl-CoA dehydrogenase